MKKGLSILLLHLFFLACPGQDSLQKSWELKGYIKDLNSFVFSSDFKNVSYTNLIHNRINFKWKPFNNITAALEVRNRLYWGNDVKEIPDFENQLRNVNDAVDLSATWKISSNTLFVSNVERLWVEYRRTKWNIKAGRQRVNWGIANTWNPNDIFNAYNFLDFDYEERPGCDALKIQYAISDFSNVEISSALTGEGHQTISAIRYLTNYKGFDLQFISGVFHNNFTAGLGWAGSISNVGYKGEGQFFLGNDGSPNDINLTTEVDYFFKGGWYANSAILYNENGLDAPVTNWSQVTFKISPTSLMPAKWNILAGCSKEFTPLFSGSLNVIYSPGVNLFILYPSFKYNLASSLDIDFVWQSLFAELESKFQDITHAGFVRLKWSF